METIKVQTEFPAVFPHGWKKGVAKRLKIHPNTVKNALKTGKGDTYNRIMKTAREVYGRVIIIENTKNTGL